jgi:glycosyltransferase involved in cell wall biosynthesis
MNEKEGYIPKGERKKILLISDDIRSHSGVAQISREMVINTCHRYNYTTIAGAVNHPEKGQCIDLSDNFNQMSGETDSSVNCYPTNGYGTPEMVRHLIKDENPDAIFLITDPRYFVWLFQMESEIRKNIPIIYLNIWDDYPAPMYNKEYYESCDMLLGISKQTVNINRLVLGEEKASERILRYVPHGLNHHTFKPLEKDNEELKLFKKQLLGNKEYDFVLLFNSRNIRRKSIPDTLIAWKMFLETLPKSEAKQCALVLHTDPIDNNGTDLPAVSDYLFGKEENDIIFSNSKLPTEAMNLLYNSADGVVLLSSNEGWGLALTEALLSGVPIIANVTGGMQDQMRFVDSEGKWFTPDENVPSNHMKTHQEHGEWAFPVFPGAISCQGSVPTPYIYDDRCSPLEASHAMKALYDTSKEERKRIGLKGREWATGDEAGFTSEIMGKRISDAMDKLFNTWEPRFHYEFLKDTDYERRLLPHKLVY